MNGYSFKTHKDEYNQLIIISVYLDSIHVNSKDTELHSSVTIQCVCVATFIQRWWGEIFWFLAASSSYEIIISSHLPFIKMTFHRTHTMKTMQHLSITDYF